MGKGTKVCINGPGLMTKMAATPIYGKNLKNVIFSRTRSPMILKLGMKHWGIRVYKNYINDDTRLTLSYSTARSNLVVCVFEWAKLLNGHSMVKTCSK